MSFINFESARDKDRARQELKEAREHMLKKAQQDALRRAERETEKLLSGETNWMLPAVAAKLEQSPSNKKPKKAHKDKKAHKSKKSLQTKHKRKYNSSHNSSDSDNGAEKSSLEEEEGRQHKGKKFKKSKKKRKHKHSKCSESSDNEQSSNKKIVEKWIKKPIDESPPQRDSWMMNASEFSMKTFAKDRNEQKRNEQKPTEVYDPAKSSRELNPHWKTTGTGLPIFQKPREYSDDEGVHLIPIHKPSVSSGWRKKSTTEDSIPKKRISSESDSDSSLEYPEKEGQAEVKQSCKTISTLSSDFLTDQQMNELGAKILKAEILGNTEAVADLRSKLEKAREKRDAIKEHRMRNFQNSVQSSDKRPNEEYIVLTRTDKEGNIRPLQIKDHKELFDSRDLYGERNNRKKSGKRTETHVNGERVRYFPDDDKYNIKQMFEREKNTTSAEANLQFANIASKHKNPNDDLEDIFAEKISKIISERDSEKNDMNRAINEHKKLEAQLEKCDKCFDSHKMNKSLIVCMGEKIYLALPWYIGLQTGHCLIVSNQHVSCSTLLDEDAWGEVENFCKALTQMFAAQRKDVIFFEIANELHRSPHLQIHCVPIPMSQGESAPFYFKKAIEESEHEWSVNKQLVKLSRTKGLRNSIPKGLPYFWVQFGIESGFAHVIEDENRFPRNFALEIIGGMLQLDSFKWRKPQKEQNFIPKIKTFADWWKKYDFTQ